MFVICKCCSHRFGIPNILLVSIRDKSSLSVRSIYLFNNEDTAWCITQNRLNWKNFLFFFFFFCFTNNSSFITVIIHYDLFYFASKIRNFYQSFDMRSYIPNHDIYDLKWHQTSFNSKIREFCSNQINTLSIFFHCNKSGENSCWMVLLCNWLSIVNVRWHVNNLLGRFVVSITSNFIANLKKNYVWLDIEAKT